jgi:LmbE family N-acetylglucosaminyl deacetylase
LVHRLRRTAHAATKFLQQAVFAVVRWTLILRARDVTDELGEGSCLVIAPHPDDETLGCGATMARVVRAGQEVRVVVVTDGRDSHRSSTITPEELARRRRTELFDACRALGVPADGVVWLGFEDGRVSRDAPVVARQLATIVTEFTPRYVLAPSHVDEHPDHRALASIIRGLVTDGTVRCPVYEYPIWFFHARTWLGPERVTPESLVRMVGRVVAAAFTIRSVTLRTAAVIEHKRRAVTAFRSQTTSLTGETGPIALDVRFRSHFLGAHEIFFGPLDGSPLEASWWPDDL